MIHLLKVKILLLLSVLMCHCAPSRFVRPLEKQKAAASVSLGGPLIGFAGKTIPMPLTSIGAAYGATADVTVFGNVHTTSMLFGVFMLDAGVVKELKKQNGYIPGISVAPSINVAVDKWTGSFKLWPQLDLNAYMNYRQKKNYFYLGVSNFFELASKRAHGEKQQHHWTFMPQAGHVFVRPKMEYVIEMKYIDPFTTNKNIVVDYKTPFSNGAIGIYAGIIKKF